MSRGFESLSTDHFEAPSSIGRNLGSQPGKAGSTPAGATIDARMLKPPWVGRAELEAVAGTATQVEFMAEFDREQYWKSRGEQAIRDEMERAVER